MSEAKIVRPQLEGAIPRERLFERIDGAQRSAGLWIMGPPGAGKTILAVSYLDHRPLRGLWYQLDRRDADVAVFFHYWKLALQGVLAAKAALPVYGLLAPSQLPAFARYFFDALYTLLETPFLCVLDNYHELSLDSAVHDVVRIALEQCPVHGSFLILSRERPPAVFARLRVSGMLQELAPETLHCRVEEVQQLAERRGDCPLSRKSLEILTERSQGWTAGVVLLMEQTAHAEKAPHARGEASQAVVFDYFASKVFERFDLLTREVLLLTSVVSKLTASLACVLSEQEKAGEVLAALSCRGTFIVRHPALPESVFQVHPLFHHFLVTRARVDLGADRVRALMLRAAEWLSTAGQVEEAAEILHESEDWQHLAELILGHAMQLYLQARFATLKRWISSFPKAELELRPWLLYWLGACQLPRKDGTGRQSLVHALDLFRQCGEVAGVFSSWARVVGSYLGEMGDLRPIDHWIDELEALVRVFPDFPSYQVELDVVVTQLGALVLRRPGHTALRDWAARAYRLLEYSHDDFARLFLAYVLYEYEYCFGRCRAAQRLAEIARVPLANESAAPVLRGFRDHFVALAAWRDNDPALCLRVVECSLAEAEADPSKRLPIPHLLTQGVMGCLTANDHVGAQRMLDKLAALLPRYGAAHREEHAYMAAQLALQQEDVERAEHELNSALELSKETGFPFKEAIEYLGLAYVGLMREDFVEARRALALAQRFSEQTGSPWFEFSWLWCRAAIEFAAGEEEAATAALRRAAALGRKQGYLNFVGWYLPRLLSRLCAEALARDIEPDYVRRLIREHHLVPESPEAAGYTWPWPLRVVTFGRFEVCAPEGALRTEDQDDEVTLQILRILVAAGGYSIERAELEAVLPHLRAEEAGEPDPLRGISGRIDGIPVLRVLGDTLRLDSSICWVDAFAFTLLSERISGENLAQQTPEHLQSEVERLLELYRGPFLPSEDGAWVRRRRRTLAEQFRTSVIALGCALEAQNSWHAAADFYRRALESDDLVETFYQRLMLCCRRLGHTAEAAAIYRRCRDTLALLRGCVPSRSTQEIYRSLVG